MYRSNFEYFSFKVQKLILTNAQRMDLKHKHRIKKSKSKVVDCNRGVPKAPLSKATTSMCREGRFSIPCIAPLYS